MLFTVSHFTRIEKIRKMNIYYVWLYDRLIGPSACTCKLPADIVFFPSYFFPPSAPSVTVKSAVKCIAATDVVTRRPKLSIATTGYFFSPVVEKCKICLLSITPTDKKIKDCRHGVTKKARRGYGRGVWVWCKEDTTNVTLITAAARATIKCTSVHVFTI